jgi:hypothetical protein
VNEKHGFWYLLSGLVIGLGIGILVAWVIAPVQYVDTTPASLRVDYKDEYRFMIASAYAANNDLLRAQARLGTLEDPDALKALGEQAQRMLASSSPMNEVQILADLSTALRTQPTTVSNPTVETTSTVSVPPTSLASAVPLTETPSDLAQTTASEISPTPTTEITFTPQPKPISTIAPRPTQAFSPTPSALFELTKRSTFCDPTQPGLLQVNLTNQAGQPAAGIELVITWANGEEHFFTGLKPELGYGYADYTMTEKTEYVLSLSGGATQITGLSTSGCTNSQGGSYPGGIHLEFKQP